MNEPRVPLLIRISASLKARVAELAKREHRSTNQQIEFLLEHAVAQMREETNLLRAASQKRKSRGEGA